MKLNRFGVLFGFLVLFAVMTLPQKIKADEKLRALYVNGIDVLTCKDKADVLGDGTVSFDAENGVLTLNGATLTKGYTKESYAENPRIFFEGDLIIHLTGTSKITCGTTAVMSQSLRDNAVFGNGKLSVTADENAILYIDGMVSTTEYVQKSGTVTISLTNDHTKMTK